jgi:hypothetical protein
MHFLLMFAGFHFLNEWMTSKSEVGFARIKLHFWLGFELVTFLDSF